MRLLLPIFLALIYVGCDAGDGGEPRPAMIAELDTLSNSTVVSINGTVLEVEGERSTLVHDQSGLVRVEFPERVHLPEGTSVGIQGVLTQSDSGPVVSARTWLYDSTAVPVRSP